LEEIGEGVGVLEEEGDYRGEELEERGS